MKEKTGKKQHLFSIIQNILIIFLICLIAFIVELKTGGVMSNFAIQSVCKLQSFETIVFDENEEAKETIIRNITTGKSMFQLFIKVPKSEGIDPVKYVESQFAKHGMFMDMTVGKDFVFHSRMTMNVLKDDEEYNYVSFVHTAFFPKMNEKKVEILDKKLDEIIDELSKNAMWETNEGKVSLIGRYLASYKNKKTDILSFCGTTAYELLINNDALCSGYADAFYLLCQKAGVECYFVSGTLSDQMSAGPHANNLVRYKGDLFFYDGLNTIGNNNVLLFSNNMSNYKMVTDNVPEEIAGQISTGKGVYTFNVNY